MIICVCGKSCSGKTSLAKKIANYYHGAYIDVDKIGHAAIGNEVIKKKLVETFGEDILINDEINRKKLSEIVFNSKEEMGKLVDVTWPYMEYMIDEIISNNSSYPIVLDYLLLPKTKYFNTSDIRILLDIPYETRKERAIKRDNITEEDFLLREKATYEYNKDDFDIILKNNDLNKIKKLVNKIDSKILKK